MQTIFFSMGAVLFGLGVILLFAYNWEKMHKFAKLAVILMVLLSAHGTGFWLRRPAGRYRSAGEGLHLTATMLFSAGIWLVAFISMARYTDLFVSLLARSSAFLLLGAALFAVGLYYSRTKKQLQDKAT